MLAAGDAPLTATALAQRIRKTGEKVKAKELEEVLAAWTAERTVFVTPAQGKGKPAYSVKAPIDLAAAAMETKLRSADRALTMATLKSALSAPLKKWYDEALGRLIVQGRAHYLPKGKTRLVLGREVKASDLLDAAALRSLGTLLKKVNTVRKPLLELAELVAFLNGISLVSGPVEPKGQAGPTDADFHRWYEDDRRGTSSKMVPVPKTWKRYVEHWERQGGQAQKADFIDRMKDLYQSDRILLEPPEYPQELPEQERELLVPQRMGAAAYYWCWVQPA